MSQSKSLKQSARSGQKQPNRQRLSRIMPMSLSLATSVLHTPLLLSDSRLHLFLQSDLGIAKIERCALGKSRYTVAEAIQRTGTSCVRLLEDKRSGGFDCERWSSEQRWPAQSLLPCWLLTFFFCPTLVVCLQVWEEALMVLHRKAPTLSWSPLTEVFRGPCAPWRTTAEPPRLFSSPLLKLKAVLFIGWLY